MANILSKLSSTNKEQRLGMVIQQTITDGGRAMNERGKNWLAQLNRRGENTVKAIGGGPMPKTRSQ